MRHPNERRRSVGTASLVASSLTNFALYNGINFSQHKGFLSEIEGANRGEVGLLFPGPGAQPLDSAPATLRTLLLLDGTWNDAKKIYRLTQPLQQLPKYSLLPAAPSRYQIRKTIHPSYLSTIEAVAEALRIRGEPRESYQQLHALFDQMVARQLRFIGRAPRQRRSAELRQKRLEERVVNWYLYNISETQRQQFLRGEIELPHRPLIPAGATRAAAK